MASLPAGGLTQSFTLTASATATGAEARDTDCATLTLNSRGTKGATGAATTCG